MGNQECIEIDSVSLISDFSNARTDSIVWVPDEFEVRLQQQNDAGELIQSNYSYACLEHLFLVLDQIGKGEPGDVIFGTGGMGITFSKDRVVLEHRVNIVGSLEAIRESVEDLILQTFEELRQRGVDTRAVAEEIATGRFAPWTINPQTTHNRLPNR